MNRLAIALLLGSLAVSIGCKKPSPPAAPVAAAIGVPADASVADRTNARQTARSVVGQLKRGAKFEDISRKLSTETGPP